MQSAGSAAVAERASEHVSIVCHEDEVPTFVEAELERLYGHIFSSLMHFRTYDDAARNMSTYIVRRNNAIVTIFLFRREKGRVKVLNEGMKLDEQEVRRFASHIFSTYENVNAISFHAVRTEIERLPFPYQRFICSNDIVLTLPDSREAYLASLGKSTRSYLHRYENKLRRTFPSFRIEIFEKDEINEQDIRDIARLNRARMASKDKVSSNDDDEAERIIRVAKACGLVAVVRIDGQVRAGVINYRVGNNYFMVVIAHDPEYNDYRLGTVCCFLTICECIARGGKEFHFLWGQYEYKYRLGGIQWDLDRLAVYRSHTRFLLSADLALKNAIQGYLDQARQWLQYTIRHEGKDSPKVRVILGLLNGMRGLKRFGARLLPG
jgi:hypothetical protein